MLKCKHRKINVPEAKWTSTLLLLGLKIITQIYQTDVTTNQATVSVSLQLLIDRNMSSSKLTFSALLIKYKKKSSVGTVQNKKNTY